MSNTGTILIAKSVVYLSEHDESAFFEWLEKIKCVERITGSGDELYIKLKESPIDNMSLREILALFYRYDVDMKQLAQFLNNKNKKWFYGPQAYWFERVFDTENSSTPTGEN